MPHLPQLLLSPRSPLQPPAASNQLMELTSDPPGTEHLPVPRHDSGSSFTSSLTLTTTLRVGYYPSIRFYR